MRPDMPDGFIWRTARKDHQCNGDGSVSHRHADDCPHKIEAGEGYVEYHGDTPAYQSGCRITVQCYHRWWLGVLDVEDQGMWRGKHCWQIRMEDERGRAQVQAHGDTAAEAIAHATEAFANRRIWTAEERAALGRSSATLRGGLLDG